MIPLHRQFDLWEPLRWAVADPNRGPELARCLEPLVEDPGEESAALARRELLRLFEEFCREGKA